MNKRILVWRAALFVAVLVPSFAGMSGAQVLNTGGATSPTNSISYQAQITGKDGKPISGEHTVTITLYTDANGTQSIWTATTKSSIGVGGILNAALGTTDNPLPTPSTMDRPLWVGVSVDATPELRPLATLSAAPVAVNVADNAITSTKLAPNAVTADKIGADYVGSISVNGERITEKGSDLNIVTGRGISSTYVSTSNSLVLTGASSDVDGKVAYVAHDPCSNNSDGNEDKNTVSGGCLNVIYGPAATHSIEYSVIAGGSENNITTFFPGDDNPDAEGTNWHVISGGFHNAIMIDVHSGVENPWMGASTIGGGQEDTLCAPWGFVGGGEHNVISDHIPIWDDDMGHSMTWDVIAGGQANLITQSASHSTIGGGVSNTIQGNVTWVTSGHDHTPTVNSTANEAFIGGGNSKIVSADGGTIGGGWGNEVPGHLGAILGGNHNTSAGDGAGVVAGATNTVSATNSFVGGGNTNIITSTGTAAVVGGGWLNTATGSMSAILGGDSNIAQGDLSAVGGGELNKAYGSHSAIAGGKGNVTGTPIEQGQYAFVGGGLLDTAVNNFSGTVAGINLKTTGEGQVVMGWKNIRAGGNHALFGGPNNDRILEIGSPRFNGPDWNPLNAFEVSYNGHSIVYDVNGSIAGGSRPVIQGATYVESPVYAWGEIDATGAPVGNANFGISGVTFLPPNIYKITMNPISPYGGALPDIREASITVTVVNNDTSDLGPFFAEGADDAVESASPEVTSESVPDSVVRALLGDSPVASGSRQTTRGVVQAMPLAPTASCGYATASQIGVKAAQPRTFYIRTYTGTVSGCQGQPLPFFFKVCHR